MNLSKNSYIAIECLSICDDSMIIVILYTVLLLFIDRTAVSTQCMIALEQWYQYMIPALFPMMLFSSILVDTGVAAKIGGVLASTILKPFGVSKAGGYCMLTGFLFGFPMGAKTTSDMCIRGQMSKEEGNYLLTFINCIGPMYTLQVTHTLFPKSSIVSLMLGAYLLPFLYGLVIRYSVYKNMNFESKLNNAASNVGVLDALYESVPKSSKSILYLGGYMVLFQISFVTLQHILNLLHIKTQLLYPLLEITGGLYLLPKTTSLPYILFYTIWGGACCFLQSYSFIKPSVLDMKSYFLHKTILATVAFLLASLFGNYI